MPFSHEPIGEPPGVTGRCIVYGSSGMMNLARRMVWSPGGWDGPAFSMQRLIEELGSLALNADAVVTPYSKAAETIQRLGWGEIFIRPDAERKEFPGELCSVDQVRSLIQRLDDVDYFAGGDNPIILATPKSLGREWRAFVVDGKVVEISLYAEGGEPTRRRGAPDAVVSMVTRVAEIYAPAPVFVADIAEALDDRQPQLRVVEYNSFNSSGFYACSIERVAAAVTKYVSASASLRSASLT